MEIEMKENVLYSVRYLWLNEGDNMCVKILTGVKKEHEDFYKSLLENSGVIKAGYEYVCEYDISYCGKFFTLIEGFEEKE